MTEPPTPSSALPAPSVATWPTVPPPHRVPPPPSPPPTPLARLVGRELLPLATLAVLALLVAWNRAVYDVWLGRHDILAQWLPWNDLLGQRLRAIELPGWNPHQFSGAPLAGDAQSGWMYFPTMIPFTLWDDPLTAFKVKVAFDLLFAVGSMYALARTLRIGRLGGVAAAIVFAFGPLSYHETHCCTVRSLVALWIPTAFLGVELAVRARSWPARAAGIGVGAFAVSQMLAGFPGQGAYDACLLVCAWVVYRAVIAPPGGRAPFRPFAALRHRLILMAVTGVGTMLGGVLLDLAALWPRLEVYAQSSIAIDGYGDVIGYDVGPYDAPGLVRRLLVDAQGSRDVTIAAAGIVLCLLAPFLARTRFGVPFFAGMTAVVLLLTQADNPAVWLFNLAPGWADLHSHNVPIVLSVLMVGPAMLAGASVDRLGSIRGRLHWAPVVFGPLAIILGAYAWIASRGILVTPTPIIAAALVTLLVWALVDDRWVARLPRLGRLGRALPAVVVFVVWLQPMGLELANGALGQSRLIREWQGQYSPNQPAADAAAIYTGTDGPGGSGQFLLDRQREDGHFRYVSYVGTGQVDGANPGARGTLVQRRYDPHTQALQANGRSIYLGLHETQGYNPIQLDRYVDLITAINGKPQDYHFADLFPPGGDRDLLDLLNVSYVLVDASLPPTRADVVALTGGREKVYEDEWVSIWDNRGNLGPAWITYDVQSVARDAVTGRLTASGFDPGATAIVEGDAPVTRAPPAGATGTVQLASFRDERVTYRASSPTDGFLVMSEVYAPGWTAYLDGDEVDILPTDLALRGVALPAGDHTVELRYEPLSLRLGLVVSALAHAGLIGVVGWATFYGVRGRRSVDGTYRLARRRATF